MVTHTHAPLVVWPHPGITPLEMWDVLVDGKTLFARRDEPTFFESLARATMALRDGEATRANGQRLPRAAWDTIALVGGAVDVSRAESAFAAAGAPLDVVSADPFFVAETAARPFVAIHSNVFVVDVGQTAIKAVGGARVLRDRSHLAGDDRAAFARFIAATIEEMSGGSTPDLVLLALPCEVTAIDAVVPVDVLLGASTYPTEGDAASLVEAIGMRSTAFALVNDAVLAAWALGHAAPRTRDGRLVLTVGLGVGGAFEGPRL